jgi:thiol-disulfide isomerase/thioredoxin
VSSRAQLLLLLLLSTLVFGFHYALKERPNQRMIAEMAHQTARPRKWQGKVAPDLDLAMRDGSTFHLSDHIGKKIVVLNFFATWCAPCRAEMPELTRYAAKRKDEPFLLIGIDANEDAKLVDAFVKNLQVGFPVGIDDGTIAAAYGVNSYPTTVLIGVDGRVHLYETTAIMNAEVALDAPVAMQLARLADGGGIPRDAYQVALMEESFAEVRESQPQKKDQLTGRAKELATRMACVCGCDDTVIECECKVSDGMRARLRELAPDEKKTDVEIMEAVNAEFCMKEM